MLFTDEFIESLRDDPVKGTIELCDITFAALEMEGKAGWEEEDFQS